VKVALDVNDIVKEVIALVQHELISPHMLLRLELAPSLPLIVADRVQLQQVVINLVMNGIEAVESVTDRLRELAIRSRQEETLQVLVSVTDCGVGISAENADRLFNAFFTTKSSGMGMGLSICRSIMVQPTMAGCGPRQTYPTCDVSVQPAGERRYRLLRLRPQTRPKYLRRLCRKFALGRSCRFRDVCAKSLGNQQRK
jgi:Histidine kinase-, DNA gyrase B-, and HSP90-like ATPase